METTSEMYS